VTKIGDRHIVKALRSESLVASLWHDVALASTSLKRRRRSGWRKLAIS
jgi:hypothetical protein